MVRSETGPKMLSPTSVLTVLFLIGLHKVGATWPGDVIATSSTTAMSEWISLGKHIVDTSCGMLPSSQFFFNGYVIALISYRNEQFIIWNGLNEDLGDGGKWRLLRIYSVPVGGLDISMQFKVNTADWVGSFQLSCYLYLNQSKATEALQSFLAQDTTTTNGPSTTSPAPSPTSPAPSPTSPAPSPTSPAPFPTSPAPSPTSSAPSPTSPAPSPTSPAPSPASPAPSPTSPAPSPTSLSTLASTTTGKPTTQTPTAGTTYSSTTATVVTAVSQTQPIATVMTLIEVAAIADRPVKDYFAVSSSNMTDHITSSPALWDRFSPNVLTCARQCLRDLKCLALFYTTSQQRCLGHHSHVQYDPTNLVSSTGTQYYKLV